LKSWTASSNLAPQATPISFTLPKKLLLFDSSANWAFHFPINSLNLSTNWLFSSDFKTCVWLQGMCLFHRLVIFLF
jgi:hypothetical protein